VPPWTAQFLEAGELLDADTKHDRELGDELGGGAHGASLVIRDPPLPDADFLG
jgi:hypothetical protein